jgi:hypothetical protein
MSVLECKPCCTKSQYEPVALCLFKRGRDCVIAKLTTFIGNDEPILAIAVKNQVGTSEMISLPLVIIDYAQQQGVMWLYWRRDRFPMEMRRVELQTLKGSGYLQRDGEIYFPLEKMEIVPWCQWEYAQRVVRLDYKAEAEPDMSVPKQLSLAWEKT